MNNDWIDELCEWVNGLCLGFWMIVLTVLIFSLGCNSLPPPPAITLKSDASDVMTEAVWTARNAWCAADVGWCPEVVEFGGADIHIRSWSGAGHFAGPGDTLEEAGWKGPAGHEDAWSIEVPPEFATEEDLPWILTHEFGHFCIEGHVASSLIMSAQPTGRPEPVVDEPARRSWLQACPR